MHSLLLLAFAAAPPAEPADIHDLVLMHPARPLRLRLHLRDDGRSFLAGWNQQVGRLFRHLDADGDGRLGPAELRAAPGREQWLHVTSGERVIDPEAAPPMAEVAGRRGHALPADLEAYYARSTSGPLQVHWEQSPTSDDAAGNEAWRSLVPGGHPLTVERLKAATKLMESHDADEDETVSEGELAGVPTFFRPPTPATRGLAHGPAAYGLPFFSARPEERDAGLADALKAKYKRVEPAWARAAPDVELRMEIGTPAAPVILRCRPDVGAQPTRGGVRLAVDGWMLHVGLDVYPSATALREDARARFKQLDADANGY
ncbi:MAG: hypothetical protein ACRC33_27300, partial [Gemmataceae bacterium]